MSRPRPWPRQAAPSRRRHRPESPADGERQSMDPQQQTLHVAMVDDEEPLCLGVRRILKKYEVHVPDVHVDVDFTFTYFTNGEGLIEAIKDGAEYDLLLLDLKLPGMSGLDVLTA
ncbi:MAG: response regulator, partial [Chloroflexi bacterium]|nr:response regulator [Chloroflexota bacterium]